MVEYDSTHFRQGSAKMNLIEEIQFDSFPDRSLIMAYCQPKEDLGQHKDYIMSQGLIAINSSLILDPFVLKAAANRAVINQRNNSMRTKGLAAELLYSLSPTLHVTESLKSFGLSPGLERVFILAFDMPRHQFMEKISPIITETEILPCSQVAADANIEEIVKLYKVINWSDALNEIVSTIAVKGI